MLTVGVLKLRTFANFHRRWASRRLGTTVESAYLPRPTGNRLVRAWSYLRDPATWRDVVWLIVNSTVGLLLTLGALVEGVLGLLFWWFRGVLLDVDARIVRALLSPSEKSRLAQRVAALTTSRAETVDVQATEIRRIERDLHDGAQARLVALSLSLGMAEDVMTTDPERARALLEEARTTSTVALAELRSVVRGIHPPVLADRGLAGAVQSLALASPLPVVVHAQVPGRLSAPVESAGYFAMAEVLTNAVKHSQAQQIELHLHQDGDHLLMTVRDDGVGGADPERGTGLRGVQRRLGAFDGKLSITSPPGGPTVVTMELPCESSSPKTSPSSGTG